MKEDDIIKEMNDLFELMVKIRPLTGEEFNHICVKKKKEYSKQINLISEDLKRENSNEK